MSLPSRRQGNSGSSPGSVLGVHGHTAREHVRRSPGRGVATIWAAGRFEAADLATIWAAVASEMRHRRKERGLCGTELQLERNDWVITLLSNEENLKVSIKSGRNFKFQHQNVDLRRVAKAMVN